MKYFILDVFAKGPFTGNQLAVVLQDKELSSDQMQAWAREFNFSETVFLKNWQTHPVARIFTPVAELPFAGHPTIGMAWLTGYLNNFSVKLFSISLSLGETPVEVSGDSARLTFPSIPKVNQFTGNLEDLLNACKVDINEVETEYVRVINVGPEFVVIPLKSLSAIKNAISSFGHYEKYKIYFIHKQSETSYKVRMFGIGIPEDPATGSAACALAGYLQQVRGQSQGSLIVSQGDEIGRPSEIQVCFGDKIEVSGKVNLVAAGELLH